MAWTEQTRPLLMDIRQDNISKRLKCPVKNTSTVSEPSQGREDTDCEFLTSTKRRLSWMKKSV